MTTDELLNAVRSYALEHFPRASTVQILITLPHCDPVTLCVPAYTDRASRETRLDTSPAAFVPNQFQESILGALEGKALRADALGHIVGDRSRLYRKPGGLQELRDQGYVSHHPRLGYYRPDAPPEELATES